MIRFVGKAFLFSSIAMLAIFAASLTVFCYPSLLECPINQSLQWLGKFQSLYANGLRAGLFAGFLTVGGFLLSLKTFIIVNMKKEVYDTPEYKAKWEEARELDSKLNSLYGPLKQLSEYLFVAITSAVTTAVLQFTVGLIGSPWAALVCVWAALLSVMFLLLCLMSIRSNLATMFDHLEEAAKSSKAAEKSEVGAGTEPESKS